MRCRTRTLLCFWLSYVVFMSSGSKNVVLDFYFLLWNFWIWSSLNVRFPRWSASILIFLLLVTFDPCDCSVQWDIRTEEIVQEYDRHLGAVNTITFVDQNRRFVSTSDDKSLRVWEWWVWNPCFIIIVSAVFLCLTLFSPWYNCSGWLGVKHQVTYSLILTLSVCLSLPLSLSLSLSLSLNDMQVFYICYYP